MYIAIGRTRGSPTRRATGRDATAHIARFASTHDERRHGNVRVPSGDQSTVIVDHQRASRTRLESPLDGVLSSIVPAAFFARFSNRRRLTRLATDDGALSRVFDPRRRSIRTRKFSCANSSGARRAVTLARAREGENDDEWRSFFFHRIILRRRIGRG